MVIINNNSGLTEAVYDGTNLTEIYVGNHLVWPVSPPSPIGNKLIYAINGTTSVIPCNGSDVISPQEIMLDNIDKGGEASDISGMTSVVLGDCVREIYILCFAECSAITSVTLNDNVREIGHSAFKDCVQLPSINLPSGITQISDYVFESNYELSTVNIPSGTTYIGINSFFDCLSLLDITIPSTVTQIGDGAFRASNWTAQDQYQYNKMNIMKSNRVVRCLATTPPQIGVNVFGIISGTVDIAAYDIYVPSESVEAYKSASGWSEYADRIRPIQ